jgi:ElaB/YqjD/DUF883 family membrane-anchored ribosome-binding protein
MLGSLGYSRTRSADEIERRLRAIERRLERAGNRASAGASQTADQVSELIASALSSTAERFRGGANVLGDEAARIGSKLGDEAARLGDDALRRLSKEVVRRPLVTLAVAVGIGLLIGISGSRRS